jgi:hypothetical protein
MYFQHGMMDSSYTWIGTEQSHSLAYCAYKKGFDIWLGNFRGYANSIKHVNENIGKNYWNYTFNEHAFQDIRGIIEKIIEIKAKENISRDKFKLTAVKYSFNKIDWTFNGKIYNLLIGSWIIISIYGKIKSI